MRLFEIETVAAIDLPEMCADSQPVHDGLADLHRLVGQHGHPDARVPQPVERFPHAGVKRRVVQHVIAIILQEELQRFLHLGFGGLRSQHAADQHRRAVAHVGVDSLMLDRRHAHVAARGIGGMRQVELGIDQRAVQIEDDQIHYAAATLPCARDSARTGLRRALGGPSLYSAILRCSVLR